MLGALIGDLVGSVYEFDGIKTKDFPLIQERCFFTDDTLLTVAVARSLLDPRLDLVDLFHDLVHEHPEAGWGTRFMGWGYHRTREPYGSLGNGSAMRVSPVAWAFEDLPTVLARAEASAAVTHNHPEGILGARAVAACIFLARTGNDRAAIRDYVVQEIGYPLDRSLEEIRPGYRFNETCPGSVPESIQCVLESTDFEDAVRNAVSLGGDADTMACIAGSIAEAFYGGVPPELARIVLDRLREPERDVVHAFQKRFGVTPAASGSGDGSG